MARLLWLDDRIEERRNEIEALSRVGHDVVPVSSESEAVKLLEQIPPPDLVIQDLHRRPSEVQVKGLHARRRVSSSHMAGWSFYQDVLRAEFPEVPVIVYTIDALKTKNVDLADEYNLSILRKSRLNISSLIDAVHFVLEAQHAVLIKRPSPPSVFRVDFNKVNAALIRHLSQHPPDLHQVSWSTFEELVATLLRELGYEVWRTPLTRDGGVDIWAIQHSALGDILFAIDAKKYSASSVLGPEPVRAIHGVAEAECANVGMIVTTATFGPAAKAFSNQLRNKISLRDFSNVVQWIRAVEQL